ncbi:hypothetical protein [Actinomadura sp. 9N215]|uniref:hypothetical protein n=1 Tax=Actinomadura sp. 9N215 TaxID=3375150 RepID=UPI00378ACE29
MPVQRVRNVGTEPAIFTAGRVVGRFVSGRPMDGVPRSNATFTQRGTKSLIPHRDRPSRWMQLPGWQRAAWRAGFTVPTLTTPVGLWVAPIATYTADGALTAGLTAWGTWRTRRAMQLRKLNKEWVKPLHYALHSVIGQEYGIRPSDYLRVPLDLWTNEETAMRVDLPAGFNGDGKLRDSVERIISEKLALPDLRLSWNLAGGEPHIIVRQAPRPPDKAKFLDYLPLIDAAPDSAPLLGIGHHGSPVSVDLDTESPHILVSMSTGGGKSVLLKTIAIQALRRGGFVVICDRKRVSHKWTHGIPGIEYNRDIAEIHNATLRVAAEGERRFAVIQQAIEQGIDLETLDLGPRIFLLMEEMNATVKKLESHWAKVRPNGAQRQSPAIEALGEILFMGREAKIHVIAVGQLMTAKALGGPEMRECFSTRILARYSRNAWKMLVPEVWPPPKAFRKSGRVQVVLAGEAHETQVLFATDQEAREWVLSGPTITRAVPVTVPTAPADGEPLSEPVSVPTSQDGSYLGNSPGTVPGDVPAAFIGYTDRPPGMVRPNLHVIKGGTGFPESMGDDELIGLREACQVLIPNVSLESARAARKRDDEFPNPVTKGSGGEHLFRKTDLIRWARNRKRATG